MTLDATSLLPFGFDSGATFSPDRLYRYRLWRSWGSREHRCVFVGLNPSTADEEADDPTIRKCVGFAKRWGFGAIDMVNLFAWRSTKPTGCRHESVGQCDYYPVSAYGRVTTCRREVCATCRTEIGKRCYLSQALACRI